MKRLLTLAALGAGLANFALAVGAPQATPPQEKPQEREAPKSEHRWFADYDEAVAVAKAEGKDLLVDFTGSDWCHWCKILDSEVFEHDEFYTPTSKAFVLVALDFPQDPAVKAKVPNPERNSELSEKHGIQGFPTVLLMTAEGEVYGSTGYREGGAQKYAEHLTALARSGKALSAAAKRLPAAYEAAEDKAPVVREAIELLEGAVEGAKGTDAVAKIVRHAYELDPENKKGLKVRALAVILAVGEPDASDLELADTIDPKNEHFALERALAHRIMSVEDEAAANAVVDRVLAFIALAPTVKDKEALQRPLLSVTFWCHKRLNRLEDGKKVLEYVGTLGEVPQDLLDALAE